MAVGIRSAKRESLSALEPNTGDAGGLSSMEPSTLITFLGIGRCGTESSALTRRIASSMFALSPRICLSSRLRLVRPFKIPVRFSGSGAVARMRRGVSDVLAGGGYASQSDTTRLNEKHHTRGGGGGQIKSSLPGKPCSKASSRNSSIHMA